jgi:hypothetical protein
LWVLGGWSETGNLSDVWYTKDGRNWTELKSDVIWTKRHEHSAFLFQDKIWVAGGAAEPSFTLDSQVWSLEFLRTGLRPPGKPAFAVPTTAHARVAGC